MFLAPYFSEQNQAISVSAQQASDFAKKIAQDFNPIHNVGAKRFCVPGDLLFALVSQNKWARVFRFAIAAKKPILMWVAKAM